MATDRRSRAIAVARRTRAVCAQTCDGYLARVVSANLPFVRTYHAGDEWTVLGDGTRWAIVEHLASGPLAVRELADRLPVSRPAVSQHLKVLKEAGLVIERAQGTRRIYRLNPAGVAALRDQLDIFWSRALAAYEETVEGSPEETK